MKKRVIDVTTRVALFALLWLLLAGVRWETPVIAVLAVAVATASSLILWPAGGAHLRWTRVPALAGYFLHHSLLGGIDVARRIFSPAMPVEPEFVDYETTLRSEAGRVLFTWMIGMMPGTASVDLIEGNRITVHVIDQRDYDQADLRSLESKVADVFDSASRWELDLAAHEMRMRQSGCAFSFSGHGNGPPGGSVPAVLPCLHMRRRPRQAGVVW